MKEFHVWNTLYPGGDEPPIIFEGEAAPARHQLHREMVSNPEAYFDYFGGLLDGQRTWLAMDVTPAYAGLPAEAFDRIKRGFESRGIAVRVLFVMRDPVERCWSAVRMYRQKGLPIPGVPPIEDEQEALRAYCGTPHAQRHGRYDRTVETLDSVFAPAELHYAFYETLFRLDSLQAISRYIGIDARPEFLDRHYNVSAKRESLSSMTYGAVADAHAETLRFCETRFPQTLDLWNSYQALK